MGDKGETPYFNKTVEETIRLLETNVQTGLTTVKAQALLNQYGHNELAKEEGESIWEKIKEQFEDVLVRILILAALISFVISQFEEHEEHSVPAWVEPAVIFTILICNGVVGILNDLDAEKAISALKELQSPHALVLRDGAWSQIDARNIVPGDIVEITQGDKIPADLRMVELKTITLKADQSILTGESDPVNKVIKPITKTSEVGVLDKINYLFSGTLVNNGTAIAVVVQTGMTTEIGKVQQGVQEADKETQDEDSPLKKRINEFGDQLAKYISYICVICWLMNIPNFGDEVFGHWIKGAMYYFKVAVALAVAAIPEGLPAVITTCLALGSRRMAKKKAIIRKLPSVETLGCTTIICSDKTGTLTTN